MIERNVHCVRKEDLGQKGIFTLAGSADGLAAFVPVNVVVCPFFTGTLPPRAGIDGPERARGAGGAAAAKLR